MKNFDMKKIFTMVAGALIIALVFTIIPGGFFASAAEVSPEKAEVFAIDALKVENKIEEDKDGMIIKTELNRRESFYTVTIRTDDYDYELIVDANDTAGKVVKIVEISVDNETERIIRDLEEEEEELAKVKEVKEPIFEEFDEFKEIADKKDGVNYLDEDDYLDHGEEKPTAQAEVNEVLRDAKKAAINEFKEAENKVEAKEEFKEAKALIKEVKKNTQDDIKENKNASEEDDDKKPLVQKNFITEDKALSIALKSLKIDTDNDIKNISVTLEDDNPPAYEVKFEYEGMKYEFLIHAQTGDILDKDMEGSASSLNKGQENKENKEKTNNGKGNN